MGDPELLDAVAHLVPIDAEQIPRMRLVSSASFQCLHHELTLHFRSVDPAYTPFLGEGGPREVEATLTVDCRDPNA